MSYSLDFHLGGCTVVSEANRRDHWAVRRRRQKAQAAHVGTALLLAGGGSRPPLPCVVTLTRTGGRKMDTDNLAGAFKAVRDEVARWLQVDDGDDRVTWRYYQRVGGVKGFRLQVEAS